MDKESLSLFNETINEKFRIFGDKRFPENKAGNKCYLSMSERVFYFEGKEYYCFHLYRDKVEVNNGIINNKCISGCNLRLVKFNEEVEKNLLDK
jgi:hypothetical protein